jgi:putative selenate reductase
VRAEAGETFELKQGAHQLANFADACNDCGNCDVFCPEWGGPYKVKPRFFASEASYRAAPMLDGFLVRPGVIIGRIEGREHTLRIGESFGDGVIELRLDVQQTSAKNAPAGHRLPLWRLHAMRALYEGVMAGVNPISAAYLRLDQKSAT